MINMPSTVDQPQNSQTFDPVTLTPQEWAAICQVIRSAEELVQRAPISVMASCEAEGQEFDPVTQAIALSRYLRKNPKASISYVLNVDSVAFDELSANLEQVKSIKAMNQTVSTLMDDLLSDLTSPDEDDDISLGPIAPNDETYRTRYATAIQEATAVTHIRCPGCQKAALHLKTDRQAMQLINTKDPVFHTYQSIDVCAFQCSSCGYSEEASWTHGQRRQAAGRVIAERIRLGLSVSPRDCYIFIDDLQNQLLATGKLLVDVLQTEAQNIRTPGTTEFDAKGKFNGVYLLDVEDDWQLATFEQLEAINLIKPMGGIAFEPQQEPENPFQTPLMDDKYPDKTQALN